MLFLFNITYLLIFEQTIKIIQIIKYSQRAATTTLVTCRKNYYNKENL